MPKNYCEIDYRGDPPHVFCPVCGSQATGDAEACEHVAFTHLHEVGEFSDLAPHIEEKYGEKLQEIQKEEGDSVEPAMEIIDEDSLLCFSITTSGLGHGPAASTFTVAFDFNPPD